MDTTPTPTPAAYSRVTLEMVVDADAVPTIRQLLDNAAFVIEQNYTIYNSTITDTPTERPAEADDYP